MGSCVPLDCLMTCFGEEAGADTPSMTGTRSGALCRVGVELSPADAQPTIRWNLYAARENNSGAEFRSSALSRKFQCRLRPQPDGTAVHTRDTFTLGQQQCAPIEHRGGSEQ